MNFFTDAQSKNSLWTELLVVFGGVALLYAASQIEIPLHPVPITLQTVAVMLIGLTYTPRRAVESHLLWIGLGAIGLPVFAGGGAGFAKVMGPTGGYMAGFVVASYLMAKLKERYALNSWKSDALLCLMGTLVVFSCGVLGLSQFVGLTGALQHGVLPFILPGIVKAALLCSALQILRHYRRG